MMKKLSVLISVGILTFGLANTSPVAKAQEAWELNRAFSVSSPTVPVYREPKTDSKSGFDVIKGMELTPTDSLTRDGIEWFKVGGSYWIPAMEPNGIVNLSMKTAQETGKAIDLYGILDQPHRFAVKMVKMPGVKARLETYEKVKGAYVLRQSYDASYRKDGPKEKYGDLKTPGGPVIRYLYRTTRSSRNGRDKSGASFGVYKVSYPMPHDALPYLLSGKMSVAQFNRIPAINYVRDTLYPHPQGMLGADILIHTLRWGSLGCIMIGNEDMSSLYGKDLVSENDKEIIPFVIYDENVTAPPEGELF